MLPGATTSSVTVRGLDISYLDKKPESFSSDTPTVVFVHGFTSNKLSWISIIKALPKSWRIVAMDLPGHGDSGFRDDISYSTFDLATFLHEVHKICRSLLLPLLLLGKGIAGDVLTTTHLFPEQFFVTIELDKFHLVGESLGALISAQYASQHPDVPASLSLLCPPGKKEYRLLPNIL